MEEKIGIFVVSVTSTHLVIFKPTTQPYFNEENKLIVPKESEITSMRIAVLAEIDSLSRIVHKRKNKNEFTLYFTAYQLKRMEYSKQSLMKCLNVTRSNRFM